MRIVAHPHLRSLGRRFLGPSAVAGAGRNGRAAPFSGTSSGDHFLERRSPFVGYHRPRFNCGVDLGANGCARSGFLRQFSSIDEREELELEEEAERKIGWVLKIIFIGTASLVAFQFFPYMGDNLLEQSIALLRVKDPLFKRMGASRLARYAVDDERRMKVVELGGADQLLIVLKNAKDGKTYKEALKALVALSHCNEAAEALYEADGVAIVSAVPSSSEYTEVDTYKADLLKKLKELKSDSSFPAEAEASLSTS